MLALCTKWSSARDGDVLQYEERLAVPDTEWSESVDRIEVRDRDISCDIERTLDIQYSLREILYVMERGELLEEAFFEFGYFI